MKRIYGSFENKNWNIDIQEKKDFDKIDIDGDSAQKKDDKSEHRYLLNIKIWRPQHVQTHGYKNRKRLQEKNIKMKIEIWKLRKI